MKSRRFTDNGIAESRGRWPSVSAPTASPDQNTLRVEARAELATVAVGVDTANVGHSPGDNGVGSDFTKVEQYQQE